MQSIGVAAVTSDRHLTTASSQYRTSITRNDAFKNSINFIVNLCIYLLIFTSPLHKPVHPQHQKCVYFRCTHQSLVTINAAQLLITSHLSLSLLAKAPLTVLITTPNSIPQSAEQNLAPGKHKAISRRLEAHHPNDIATKGGATTLSAISEKNTLLNLQLNSPMLEVPAPTMLDVPARQSPTLVASGPSNPHDPGPLAGTAGRTAVLTYIIAPIITKIIKFVTYDYLRTCPR